MNFEALHRASLPTLAEGFVCFLEGSLVRVFWKMEKNYMTYPFLSILISYLILFESHGSLCFHSMQNHKNLNDMAFFGRQGHLWHSEEHSGSCCKS